MNYSRDFLVGKDFLILKEITEKILKEIPMAVPKEIPKKIHMEMLK